MRQLNEKEIEILKVKEKRLGRKLDVRGIEYRKGFPRTTICLILKPPTGYRSAGPAGNIVVGTSMRGRKDVENSAIGEVQAFVRALNSF